MQRNSTASSSAFALLVLLTVAQNLPAADMTQPAGPPSAPRRLPGMQPDGRVLLPSQWSLRPVGKQVELGDFPVNIAMHPKASWAAVLHCGYGQHEVVIVDTKNGRVQSRAPLRQAFYGLCFDPEGKRLFASGAEYGVVHQFRFQDGLLSDARQLRIGGNQKKAVPAGLSCSRDGMTLFVADAWGNSVELVSLDHPDQTRRLELPKDSYPYTSLHASGSRRLYVSLWGRAGVAVVDLEQLKLEAIWATPSHPTELVLSPDQGVLYVACANSNLVSALDTKTGRPLELISSALHPQAANGSTPNSLALSPDGKVLLIANADNNNLAVVDVSRPGQSRSLGFIPVGWYPTSVRFSAGGDEIFVANGKGLSSKANPDGPSPLGGGKKTVREYIAGLFRGALSIIAAPSPGEMARYSKLAYECSPLRPNPDRGGSPREPGSPIPARPGEPSPIKHCIYIIKENRTYDQIFGDMAEGNGEAKLCIFPERVTPNHHALARQFVLLDNFYVEGEVSADGHEWSMAAYATDFVEKTWPLRYRGGKGVVDYSGDGRPAIALPSSGYIWDRCREAGIGYRSYGEFITSGKKPGDPGIAYLEALKGHFDPQYRGWDLDYPDAKRADRFLEELKRFEREGRMPPFLVLTLPNDHTYGTVRGKPTPTAMVADNDVALGRIIEGISRSKFWRDTAVFVLEDDAQNGADHVDAHRSVALVISPYAKRRHVDSSLYSTSSMLRTMELILGLKPMSQFDAAARPMDASFQATPDFTPYAHLPARVDLQARNDREAWGEALSAAMDFSKPDGADDLQLNEVVWRSVRGADSPMPPPVRAAFLRPR